MEWADIPSKELYTESKHYFRINFCYATSHRAEKSRNIRKNKKVLKKQR